MDRREQDILDWVRQETEEIEVPKKLEPENIRQMLEEKERKERPGKKRRAYRIGFAAAACAAAVIGLAAWQTTRPDYSGRTVGPGNMTDAGAKTVVEISGSKSIARADSYDQVYGYLEAYQKQLEEEEKRMVEEYALDDTGGSTAAGSARNDTMKEGDIAIMEDSAMDSGMNGSAAPAEMAEAPAAVAETADTAAADYSETNVRQEGVDEGDIVKTDGRYLYVLKDSGREIAIVDTKDQDMKPAASIEVGDRNSIYEFYVVPKMKKLVLVGYQSG